ncbi:MAG: hypothetical protein Kapaf2KO_13140 [Candidatus Kapaibacteriales bacterium]
MRNLKQKINTKNSLGAFLVMIALSLGSVSCDKFGEGPVGNDRDTDGITSDLEIMLGESGDYIEDATIETDFIELDAPVSMAADARRDGGGDRDHRKPPKPKKFLYGAIFRQLELSDEQIEIFKTIREDYRNCMKDAKESFRENYGDILKEARANRALVIDAFKANEISREEAHEQIKAINTDLREVLAESRPDVDPRCECIEAFHAAVTRLLQGNDEQLAKWEAFLERAGNPCEGEARG